MTKREVVCTENGEENRQKPYVSDACLLLSSGRASWLSGKFPLQSTGWSGRERGPPMLIWFSLFCSLPSSASCLQGKQALVRLMQTSCPLNKCIPIEK